MSTRIDLTERKISDERRARTYDVAEADVGEVDYTLTCLCWTIVICILTLLVWIIMNSIRNHD